MAKAPFSDLLLYLRKVCGSQAAGDLTDAELVERFRADRDEVAFSVLVHRHGPMVLSVCQRVLGQSHSAEDAFQATFMVLVRRAASISRTASVGAWLQAVAQRVATKARNQESKRRQKERRFQPMRTTEPLDDLTWQELRAVLDEEIARLAEKYRAPLVLCYLEGKSYDQAGRELGWPKGSVTTRLSRARELLRQRLVRRGITLSAGALATVLCEKVSGAAVGAMLTINTVKAATSMAAGKAVASGCLSVQAIALAEHGMTGMLVIKAKVLVMVLLGLAAGGAGVAGFVRLSQSERAAEVVQAPKQPAKIEKDGKEKKDAPAATDLYGDPLPPGAVRRLGTVRFRPGAANALAFSCDGKILASAGGQNLGVQLWDAATGRLLHRLPFPDNCSSLAVSADGKIFVAGGDKPSLIDMATGKELRRFEIQADVAEWCLALSPDGRTLAAGSRRANLNKSTLVLLDVATGQVKGHLKDFGNFSVHTVSFSPDGKLLASGSADKTVRIWDVATGKELQIFEGHEREVHAVAFSPTGKSLASSEEREVRLRDPATGKALHTLKIESLRSPLAFSPDGKLLAYEVRPGTVCLWDAEVGKEVRQWVANTRIVESLAFSPDGKVLVSGGLGDAIRKWEVTTGMEIEPDAGHTGALWSLLFAPDGKTLFSCGTDWKILEWDLATGRQRRQLLTKPKYPAVARWPMSTFALAPDGKALAWTGLIHGDDKPNRAIHLWDTSIGKEIGSFNAPRDGGWMLRFSPDAKHLASISNDGTRLWDVTAGKELHFLRDFYGQAFSPDGQLLAGSSKGFKSISLWSVAAGKELRSWDSHGDVRTGFVFSPDGKLLASKTTEVSDGGLSVRVWAIDTGKQLMHFDMPKFIDSLAFSPSGRLLAAAVRSDDPTMPPMKSEGWATYTIYLWDVFTGEEIRHFESPQVWGWSLAFAPDGRTLATSGADSTILLWDLAGQTIAAGAKSAPLTARDLDGLWADLAGDAAKADRAIWALALSPKQSLPLLKERMLIYPAPQDQLAKLIADVDSEKFAVREKAVKTLDALGEAGESAVRKALQDQPTLELRQRLLPFLEKYDKAAIRKLRALDALEYISTAQARQVLQDSAKGAANPRVREAASAALQRLARRSQ